MKTYSNEQIKNILQRYFDGNCSEQEINLLHQWILENENKESLDKLIEEFLSNQELSFPENLKDEEALIRDKIFARLKPLADSDQPLSESKQISHRSPGIFQLRKIVAIAVILVSLGSVTWFYLSDNLDNQSSAVESPATWHTKKANAGEKITITLPDKSKVILNSNSELSYQLPFNGHERNVTLAGEAFFEVKRDSLKPFIVVSGDISTTVLGTSFNMNSQSKDGVEISLVSGKVAVRSEGEKMVILNPGEIAVAKKSRAIEVGEFDYLKMIAWKDGVLVFNNATFDEIFKKLEDWYGVKIHVVEDLDEPFHYTAKYDNPTLKEVLQGIAFVQNFDFSIDKKNVAINFKPID